MLKPTGLVLSIFTMLRQSSRRTLVGAATVALASTMVVTGMVTFVLDKNASRASAIAWIDQTHRKIAVVNEVLANVADIQTGERGFLLTANPAFLAPYEIGRTKLWPNLQELVSLSADNPEETENVQTLEAFIHSETTLIAHLIDLVRGGDQAGAIAIVHSGDGKASMDEVRRSAAKIIDIENVALREQIVQQLGFQNWAMGLLIGLLVTTASGIFLCATAIIWNLLGSAGKLRVLLAAIHHDERLAALTEVEVALGKSEEQMRLALSAVNSVGTYDWDLVNDRIYANASFARIFGIDPEHAAAGAPLADYLVNVPADARAKMIAEYDHVQRTGGDCSVIYPVNQADGSVRWCLAKSHCTLAPDGTPLRMPGVLIDITDQRIVEGQLRQSQKMEAVGQLTGGLAHDFNNMLQGITGSLELLKARLKAGQMGNLGRYINAAEGDAARAATLTQRLLAFSRRQVLDPIPTSADALVAGMTDLIQRTVGPAIKIVVVPTDDLWTTLCDVNQMENALLNLCINARDAMPDGGLLTIETANVLLDRRSAFDWELMPGEYIAVRVTDTGIGMPTDVVARAFDPFFTTKPLGVGTGLGLSMIYGFAQQSGGQARIYSEVGVGTAVHIYLPRHIAVAGIAMEPLLAGLDSVSHAGQGQTVLIVDDEETIRMMITELLQELGYIVIEAEDGASGLKVLQSEAPIDLLITDVGLPGGMDGRQMADAARIVRPDLKVLFITGYAPSAVVGNGRLQHGMHVMTKPFALDTLAARVKGLISEVEAV
jgi:signal transduction histidine kinase/CHASE3 domain sensor protein/CheY-like chemotaxis protein